MTNYGLDRRSQEARAGIQSSRKGKMMAGDPTEGTLRALVANMGETNFQHFPDVMNWFDVQAKEIARKRPRSSRLLASMVAFFNCAAVSAIGFLKSRREFDELMANSDSYGIGRVCYLWATASVIESNRPELRDQFVQLWGQGASAFNRIPEEHLKIELLLMQQFGWAELVENDGGVSFRHREIVYWLTAHALSEGSTELPEGPIKPSVVLPYDSFKGIERVPDPETTIALGLIMAMGTESLKHHHDEFLLGLNSE